MSPVAADVADEISGTGDSEQEDARHQKRRRLEHRSAGQVHLDRPPGVPRGRYGEERDDRCIGDRSRDPDVLVENTKQHGVGEEEKVEAEYARETEAQRLDRPPRLWMCAAYHLLDERQSGDAERQPDAECRGPPFDVEGR